MNPASPIASITDATCRLDYVGKCKLHIGDFRENVSFFRYRYLRGKNGRKVGLVVGFIDANKRLFIGGSKYNTKLENQPFDVEIGLYKAIVRARAASGPLDELGINMAQSLHKLAFRLVDTYQKSTVEWV